jgi:cation-transporting P-type ATPase E
MVDSRLPDSGLTSAQVAERVARGEVNEVARRTSRPLADIIRANVLTRFNAIISVLSALILITGRPQDALFGLVIVVNTAIGVVQELRAKRTLDRLAVLGEEPVRVVRDGQPADVPPAQVVLGESILVGPGDRIMVDGDVTGGAWLEVDESLVTGESEPVAKKPGDRLLSGSFVVGGTGSFTATKVGQHSYAARLEAEARTFSMARSELMAGINRFLRIITWVIVPVAILLAASQLAYAAGDLPDAISGAVAGIVTMIPEGLVLLTSVAFAVGVVRLGRRRCLVQELPAIEVLARVDVLCLDKTGTLTEPGMELDEVIELTPGAAAGQVLAALARAEERPNATIQAIARGIGDAAPGDTHGGQPTQVVPFSSARKWSGAVFADGPASGGWLLGAPEVLLSPGDPGRDEADERAAGGFRVLALVRTNPAGLANLTGLANPRKPAHPTEPAHSTQAADHSQVAGHSPAARPPDLTRPAAGDLDPVALIVLRQRLRPEASRTLAYFAEQDVAVKVISGDSAASVGAIAAELGIEGAGHPIDARTLPQALDDPPGARNESGARQEPVATPDQPGPPGQALGENQLDAIADVLERNSVFGRVTPRQKQLFVAALQSRGHTVAMTGDGVNDVLALTNADLGVAMGSGSGATRAAAKIVLMDDSFTSLPHVVAEGRRVLGNIERVASLFLTKTVYAVLLSTATALVGLASLAGLEGLRFPFLPRHLTLISTLTIGVPAFFLALAPATQRVAPGFVGRVLRFAIPAGAACAAATFSSYLIARLAEGSDLRADRTTAVITLSAAALWVLTLIARPVSTWRIALVAAMTAGMLLAITVPPSRTFFQLRPYNPATDIVGLTLAWAAAFALTVYLAARRRVPWRRL